jgi:formate-dependent nitrite reductase membrane component NrfD
VFSCPDSDHDSQATADHGAGGQPGYYGLPILKRPFWKWEIALYFFFEGVSAGTFILSAIGDVTGSDESGTLARRGRMIAFATMLACPPLLIADLGRPERFHHMLRIFKKTSPMNHGAWALTGYGAFASLAAANALPENSLPFGRSVVRLFARIVPGRFASLLGLPFAMMMVSYPGVLLATTANPVWSRSNFMGPLLAASSMSSGAAALTLAHANNDDHKLHGTLRRFEDVAASAEAAAIGLYLGTAGKAAKPLLKGRQSALFIFGAIGLGLLAPAILRRSRSKVARNVIAPMLTLAGSAALKWSITYAGQESAMDPVLASRNAPTNDGKPFWGPAERSTQFQPPT